MLKVLKIRGIGNAIVGYLCDNPTPPFAVDDLHPDTQLARRVDCVRRVTGLTRIEIDRFLRACDPTTTEMNVNNGIDNAIIEKLTAFAEQIDDAVDAQSTTLNLLLSAYNENHEQRLTPSMFPNQNIWTAAIEAQQSALASINALIASRHRDVSVLDSAWQIDKALLTTAQPFAWSKDSIAATLEASKSIPLDTTLKWNLQALTAWWWFEELLPFDTILRECHGVRAMAFGWLKTEDASRLGMPVCTWLDNYHSDSSRFTIQPSQTFEWSPEQTLGEMLEASRSHHQKLYGPGGKFRNVKNIVPIEQFMRATEGLARFILAGLTWLNQKVLVTDIPAVERHARKRYTKAVREFTGVRVVHLRKLEHVRNQGESKIDWTCRWVVSGHWRNQPYGPGAQARRLTWIAPFVKGPDGQPLRASKLRVFAVDR